MFHNNILKRGVRHRPADTKVGEERGGGGAPGIRVDIPLQPVMQADHGEVTADGPTHGGPQWTCSLCRIPAGSGGCPKEAVTPREAGSWQDLWPCGGPTLVHFIPEGLHSVEGTHTSSPWEGFMLEKFTEVHI